jgi:hypothetical protein
MGPPGEGHGHANSFARLVIHENLCAHSGQQRSDPVPPARGKTKVLKHLQKEGPHNGVKGVCNVDLYQKRRHTTHVK